ncbi:cytochrome P450 [Streptomyces goshikiensis]|uniref:cytochrome P450 n=1 Tax=Streptomyces goshikiensis TaxID=1942 RepID=UPI003330A0D4
MRKPPGPKMSKLVGNVEAYEKDRLGFTLAAAQEYGDIWAFSDQVYVVTTPDLAHEVLSATYTTYGPVRNFFHRKIKGNPALQSEWDQSRTARMRGMRPSAMGNRIPHMANIVEEVLDAWPASGRLDAVPQFRRLASTLGAYVCYGPHDEGVMRSAEEDLFWALLPVVGSPIDLPEWLPTRNMRRRKQAAQALERKILGIISRRRAEGRTEGDDLLAMMMDPAARHGELGDGMLADALMATMLAAQGAPAPAMSWVFQLLAAHPEMQEQVREEARLLEDVVDAESLKRLSFTERVVKEALRLYPPNWLVARQVLKPAQLAGYEVEPGMKIMIPVWSIQRDSRSFSDPEDFRPDRWIDPSPTERRAFMPFGGGPMLCMGTIWSMMEMTLMTALVTRRWQVDVVKGAPWSMDPMRELTPNGLVLDLKAHATVGKV